MHQVKKQVPAASDRQAAGGETEFSRRDFLRGGVAAGVVGGVGLGAVYFGYGSSLPNPVRVGLIGTGDEGGVLLGAINPDYVQVVAIADIRPSNVYRAFHGDDSSVSAAEARPGLIKKYGYSSESDARRQIAVYTDGYEQLLEDPQVEGVIIALPLHLHAEASIKAMRRGKHVLCEKLMAHSVHQCKEMARQSRSLDKVLAIGHQRHYSMLYDNVAHMIRRGLIGDIHHIRAQWHRGNMPGSDSWQPPLPDSTLESQLASAQQKSDQLLQRLAEMAQQETGAWERGWSTERQWAEAQRRWNRIRLLDKDVHAEKYGYQPVELVGPDGKKTILSPLEELIRWRLFERTGGGLMAELGSHQLDAASIFISKAHGDGTKKVHPLAVYGVGGRHIFPLDRQVDDHVYCGYEFPAPDYESDPKNKRIVVTYSSINGNGFGGYGEVVMGTKGTIIVDREYDVQLLADDRQTAVQAARSGPVVLDTTESGYAPTAQRQEATGPISRGYTEQIEHWAWCIRNRDPLNEPRCDAQTGLADAVIALVSNMAIRQQRRFLFDPEWFDVNSDATPEGIAPDENRSEYKV